MQYVLTVSEINKYIREIISRDLILTNLWVKGEISNYKNHYSGHLYFTIKDEKSLIKCVMFRAQASGLKFRPEDGMKVIIRGYVSVFERDGQYQLYAEEMQPDGIGSLHIAFEQLKMKLQKEGLFDERHKKQLPYLPETIGVVTSSTGAVIRDIIHVLTRRYYNVRIRVFPVQVQGEQAAGQIARAIRKLNELDCVDVIIIARGGGSLEELWAFNEEVVARSIFDSQIPVISAVGHETDYTIADFVADLRAPTPSAAAELVMPEKASAQQQVSILNTRLRNALVKRVELEKMRYRRLTESVAFKQPFNRIYQERMRLDIGSKYLIKAVEAAAERERNRLALLIGKLQALSPLSALARGYSMVKTGPEGRFVKSVTNVQPGDRVEISVQDGFIDCTVDTVRGERRS